MQYKITVRDNISPQLAKLASRLANRQPLLQAMGLQLVSLTKRAFNEESLRASSWPAVIKSGPKNAPLKKTGALWQSIKISSLTNNSVTVSSDRKYAAIHQLGGRIGPHQMTSKKGKSWMHPGSNIPARPFFAFLPDGSPTPTAVKKLEAVLRDKLQALLPK